MRVIHVAFVEVNNYSSTSTEVTNTPLAPCRYSLYVMLANSASNMAWIFRVTCMERVCELTADLLCCCLPSFVPTMVLSDRNRSYAHTMICAYMMRCVYLMRCAYTTGCVYTVRWCRYACVCIGTFIRYVCD